MLIKLIFFLGVLICAILITENSNTAPKFIPGVNGLPLVTGLVLMPGRHIIFDTPEGRIIEAFADGKISPANILAFYTDTLPQLGWIVKSKNEFERENEVLRIEVSANKKNQSIVRFFITPDVK